MGLVNVKTGKKIELGTGYTSNPVDYQTWKRQQEAKRTAAPSSAAPVRTKAKRDAAAMTVDDAARPSVPTGPAAPSSLGRQYQEALGRAVSKPSSPSRMLYQPPAAQRAPVNESGYSIGQGLADVLKKGANQVAQAGAATLAFLEDVGHAPFELFSGMELGSLRKSGNSVIGSLPEKVREEGAALAEKSAENVRKGGAVAKALDTYGTATVAAVPQAVLAMLTGGSSAAAQTAARTAGGVARTAASELSPGIARTIRNVVGGLARDPQYWSSFSQVVGSGYQQALDDGASMPKAALYAIGNGLMNAAVEVGGGVETLPGELRTGASGWRALVDSALDEGKEEVIQGVIERAMQNLTYQKGNPLASVRNPDAVFNPLTSLGEFAGGAVVGGILSGGQIAAQSALNARADRQVRDALELMERAAQAGNPVRKAETAPGARPAVSGGTDASVTENTVRGPQKSPGSIILDAVAEGEEQGKRVVRETFDLMQRAAGMETGGTQQKTAPETGTVGYTQKEADSIRREAKTFRNIIAGIDTTVSDFFQKWRNGRHPQKGDKLEKLYLGKMSMDTLQKVEDILGYDIDSRDFIVTNEGVKHMLDQHGDAKAEIAKGNLPLTQNIIDALPEIVANPDSVEPGKLEKKAPYRQGVVFKKTLPDGTAVYIQFDNSGRGTFEGRTLYVKKGESPTSGLSAVKEAGNFTSETTEPELSASTIPQGTDSVKSGIQGEETAEMQAMREFLSQENLDRLAKGYKPGSEESRLFWDEINPELLHSSETEQETIAEPDNFLTDALEEDLARQYRKEILEKQQEFFKRQQEKQEKSKSKKARTGEASQRQASETIDTQKTSADLWKELIQGGEDGLGAADAGFTTRGMEGQERTSRMAQSHPYNQYQEAATAMTREEYARLFRYQSQTEAKTTHLAEELVYVLQNGKKTFLKDVNEDAYNALTESLREAAAWTPEQFDAAQMILNELKGKSAGAEIESEEYTNWFKEVRQHETVGGQAVQAISKWTRDNRIGLASERDALDNLEKSGLSQEEQSRIYGRIVQLDNKINAVQEGDTASLKSIILETAADRGLIRGKRGELLSLWASRALDAMNFEQMKQFAFSSTSALSSDTAKADLGQMVKTCQVLSYLSNKATVSRNLLGNTSFYGVDALAMNGAALLDIAVSKATGTRSVAMEQFALKDALRAAWISQAEVLLDVDMGGEKTRYGTGSNRTFKAGSKHAAARFLSALERNQALYLTVPDEFFKGMARGNTAAIQKLIDQGKIVTDNANYAAEQADALAKYRTFQDDTKIANAIQQVHDICNMLLGFGDSGRTIRGHKVHAFGFGDFVAAFTKVAGNLATRGIEYSPHNAVKGTLELVHQIYNAKTGKTVDTAKQAKGVSNVARGLTGAVIANVFRGLIRAGILRLADDDDDKNVAALNRSEGLDGVQLNLSAAYRWLRGEKNTEPQSGDTLIDASSLEPINQLMYAAAYLEDGMSPVSAYPSAALSAAADLPVLDTVGSVGKRVYKYGENIVDVTAEELGKTAASSVVPNALRAAARGTDDRSRNSSVDLEDVEEQDPVKRFFRIMTEAAGKQAMAGTPGLREKLPGGVSPTGQDRTYPTSQLWNLINAVINPMGVNTYTQTEQSREWQRLREETGRTDFYPSSIIPKTVEGNKLSKELSYEQRQDFQRDRGVWLMLTVSEMMGNRGYQSSDTQRQSDLMKDVREFANAAAKRAVLGPDGVDKWVNKAMEAQKATGLSPASVIYYKDLLSREKKKEGVSARDAGQTVRNAIYSDGSLTASQKNALDDMIISDVIVIPQDKNVDYSNEDSFLVSQMSDSAVKHWPLVQEKMPDVTGEQYQTAWKIANTSGTKKDPYTEAEKKRDIQEETDLSSQEVNQLLRLIKTVIDDE